MDTKDTTLGAVILGGLLKYLGIKSPTLSNQIGVEYKRLQKVETGKTKRISGDLAQRITATYPDISLQWLLTGEGSILREATPSPAKVESLLRITEREERPYYDIDFLGGYGGFLDDPGSAPVAYKIDYPPYNREGVFYIKLVGNSMSPEFNSGDLVALRAIESWADFLLLGKVYAIVTRSGQRTIKRLRWGSDSRHYLLNPANSAYETQEIPLAQIERVFEVLGEIRQYE